MLIPTFKAKYPGKKMILILDNAPYHHSYGEDAINLKSAKKSQLVALASEFGLHECKFNPYHMTAGCKLSRPNGPSSCWVQVTAVDIHNFRDYLYSGDDVGMHDVLGEFMHRAYV